MKSVEAKPSIDKRGFWLTHDEGHEFDPPLANALANTFRGYRLCDLGCGQGKYVEFLRQQQVECDGFDGNPNTPQITHGLCGVRDLSQPIELEREYDVIMSLEVAEHIPRQYQSAYLANLTKFAKAFLVLSWAVPGQAGDGHVNNRTNSYVVWKLRRLGFQLDLEKTGLLRAQSSLVWFQNTILVFSRGPSPTLSEKLTASAAALRFDARTLQRKAKVVASQLLRR